MFYQYTHQEELPGPSDPARRKDLTVEWPGPNFMIAQMNTPGRLQVLVNDVVVTDFSHWTYGQTVKITVIPERITGDWMVTLAPR